jgi:hypothetical protein
MAVDSNLPFSDLFNLSKTSRSTKWQCPVFDWYSIFVLGHKSVSARVGGGYAQNHGHENNQYRARKRIARTWFYGLGIIPDFVLQEVIFSMFQKWFLDKVSSNHFFVFDVNSLVQ